MADATGPLAGLKVVDVTHMLAGPYCTWLLGSLGADVVKVEHPERGDFTRSIAPHREGMSLYFASVNRNKRSLGLDLKKRTGRPSCAASWPRPTSWSRTTGPASWSGSVWVTRR